VLSQRFTRVQFYNSIDLGLSLSEVQNRIGEGGVSTKQPYIALQ